MKPLFKFRSNKKEMLDNSNIRTSDLHNNLQEFEKLNIYLGVRKSLLDTIDRVIIKTKLNLFKREIIIADLGCGGGDLIFALAKKYRFNKRLNIKLYGFDINPEIIAYANEMKEDKKISNAAFICSDVSEESLKNYDVDFAFLNNVCHHLSDDETIAMLKNLKNSVYTAIIIQDLHRHIVPYYAIKVITWFFNLSTLAKHDGPLSVLKGFKKIELLKIIKNAGFTNFRIQWSWPFRWKVILYCS